MIQEQYSLRDPATLKYLPKLFRKGKHRNINLTKLPLLQICCHVLFSLVAHVTIKYQRIYSYICLYLYQKPRRFLFLSKLLRIFSLSCHKIPQLINTLICIQYVSGSVLRLDMYFMSLTSTFRRIMLQKA